MKVTRLSLLFCVLLGCVACSQTADNNSSMSDPIEPFNRVMWDFNYKVLDNYIYKPTTEFYVDVVPKKGRLSINNFVQNFDEPSNIVNNLIQLDFKHSAQAFFRFSVNSTFGLLGFLDVADSLGVPRRRETFSNVLGHWSVPNGPYLMLPFLGPRSTRKLIGGVVDGLYFPFSYLSLSQDAGLEVLDGLDLRERFLGQEPLLEQSLDPYLFVKDAYTQNEAFSLNKTSSKPKLPANTPAAIETEPITDDLDSFLDEID